MTYEFVQPTEADIDRMQADRLQMLSAGTQVAEFLLQHTLRDEDTGQLRLVGDFPFEPEESRVYYGAFKTIEASGLDPRAAFCISQDELAMVRQQLHDSAVCD